MVFWYSIISYKAPCEFHIIHSDIYAQQGNDPVGLSWGPVGQSLYVGLRSWGLGSAYSLTLALQSGQT